MIPPNYDWGDKDKHCGNCGAFDPNKDESHREQIGFCNMYSMLVKHQMTCSEWFSDNRTVQENAKDSDNSPGKQ